MIPYYDDALVEKLKKWIPDSSKLRVLKPDESKRLFSLLADDNNDSALTLPFIALSRNSDTELLLNIKNNKSFDGFKINQTEKQTLIVNSIRIKPEYKLDIYAKTSLDADEYVRNFLFKLINNPVIKIVVPYNGSNFEHIANIRVLTTISDTSDISERIFSGQFERRTIQLEIQDAFLFNIPYRQNWKIVDTELDIMKEDVSGEIEEKEEL